MISSKLRTSISTFCVLLLVFTGCDIGDSDTNGGPKEVAVKMKLQSASQAKLKSDTAPTALSVDTLTEIKLLVEELELESELDDDTLDFEAEDLIVNLPMDGSEFVLTSRTIPEGVYEEFELEIENDDDGNDVNDPDFHEGDSDYSVVVKGVYNGEDFIYRSDEDFEIELDLNPPLEITGGSSSFSVNININPAGWFIDSQNGQSLDPNDPSNHEKIDENISNSFDAEGEEEDDDDDDDQDDDNDDDDDSDD